MSSKEMKTTKLSSYFLGAVVRSGEIMGSVLACIGGHARNATQISDSKLIMAITV